MELGVVTGGGGIFSAACATAFGYKPGVWGSGTAYPPARGVATNI